MKLEDHAGDGRVDAGIRFELAFRGERDSRRLVHELQAVHVDVGAARRRAIALRTRIGETRVVTVARDAAARRRDVLALRGRLVAGVDGASESVGAARGRAGGTGTALAGLRAIAERRVGA